MSKRLCFVLACIMLSMFSFGQNIEGIVWLDDNGDGIKDITEATISNMQVQLVNNATNATVLTTNTNLSGAFLFFAPLGDYYVRFVPSLLNPAYIGTIKDATGANTWPTDVDDDSDASKTSPHNTDVMSFTGAETYPNVGFGVYIPGAINGLVWDDKNGDGQKQGTEGNTLMPVNVTLIDASTGNPVTTDASGNPLTNPINTSNTYAFNNLPPGDYIIEFDEMGGVYPTGQHITKQLQGPIATDSDPDPVSGQTAQYTLNSGDVIIDIDAGYYKVGQVGDFVWEDLNGNGIQDGGEPGLSGITVELLDNTGATALDPDGNPIAAVVTAGGFYLFDMIPPGNYKVKFEVNPVAASGNTLYFTLQNQGADDTKDSDADFATGETAVFMIMSGQIENITVDAGYIQKCTIGDLTWHDLNGDGIQNGEPDVDLNIVITKVLPAGPFLEVDGSPYSPNISSSGGVYIYDNLRPGEYKLTFSKPAGFFFTLQDQGGDDDTDSDVDRLTGMTINITCTSGEVIENVDAGVFTQCKIGDFTWHDEDGDGVQGGESGLAGVTITITNFDGTTVTVQADGTTPYNDMQNSTGAGFYQFLNLPPGRYILTFQPPANWFATDPFLGGDITRDSDIDIASFMTQTLTCNSEEVLEDIDAGFFTKATLNGVAWHDQNADGIRGGTEPLLDGVTFNLINVNTGAPALDIFTNMPIGPQVTAAGMYMFNNVRPGQYTMTANFPGWIFSPEDATGAVDPDVLNDSDFDAGGNLTADISLKSNAFRSGVDAGLYKNITLSGTVWGEDDGDVMLGGPPANQVIQNVAVSLCKNNVVVDQTVTDAMGVYTFMDVMPGDYVVKVDAVNFVQNGPLYGLESCEGQAGDNDVDNDDNGEGNGPTTTVTLALYCGQEPEGPDMTINSTVDFCFAADCGDINPIMATVCIESDTICDLPILQTICSRMPTEVGPLVGTPVCPGAAGTSFHNTSWFAFVAGFGNYEMKFNIFGCVGNGVQAGIYTDCTLAEPIVCFPNCILGGFSIFSTDLTPGKVYFFFLDGCNGSVCSYDIDVIGDFEVFNIPEISEIKWKKPCDKDTICPGTALKFEVTDAAGTYSGITATYYWEVTSPTNVVTQFTTPDRFLDFTFTQIGKYIVTCKNIAVKCSNGVMPFSIEVIVGNPADEDWGEQAICEDILAVGWEPFVSTITGTNNPNDDCLKKWAGGPISAPGTYTKTIFTDSDGNVISGPGCKHKQTIKVTKKLNSKPYLLDTFYCPGTKYTILGITRVTETYEPGGEVIVGQGLNGNAVGCDSIIKLIALYLGITGEIKDIGCTPQGYKLKFDKLSAVNFNQYPEIKNYPITYEFVWIGPDGKVYNDGDPDKDSTTIFITQTGNYSLTIIQKIDNSQCEFNVQGIDVNVGNLAPPQVTRGNAWTTKFCSPNNTATYVLSSALDPSQILSYVWKVSPPGVIIGNANNDTITVNWGVGPKGYISASVTNNCGPSPPLIDSVTVTQTPSTSLLGLAPLCVDSPGILNSTTPLIIGAAYNWGLDGGNLINGSLAGPGPLEVSWASSGTKNVDLVINNNDCISTPATTKVTVVDKQLPPLIQCNESLGEIVFTFLGVAGITNDNNYTVSVLTGQNGTLTGNATSGFTYKLTGLSLLESAQIKLDIVTNSPCGNLTSTSAVCTTQNCIPPVVKIDPVSNICLTNTTTPIQLISNADPLGTFDWSGPGVSATGLFDPKTANIGVNEVTLKYLSVDNCKVTALQQIIVNITPTADIIVSDNNICQDSVSVVSYSGNITNGGEYTWTFGNDVKLPGAGAGPFDIGWDNPGSKTITLKVKKDGCESTIATEPLTVVPRIEPIKITCTNEQPTQITVGWTEVSNVSSYTLKINGVVQSLQPGQKTLTITGLVPDSEHKYELIANSSNACPGTVDTVTCYAVSCPSIFFNLNVGDTTICLNANATPFKIEAEIEGGLNTGNQVISFTGPGMSADGTFDPKVAGPNSGLGHLIKIKYKEGKCEEETSIRIRILPQPKSDFNMVDELCILDELNLDFAGTSGLPLSWKLPTGVTLTANGTNKFKTKFSAPGKYDFGLIVGNAICKSEETKKSVVVEKELDEIDINCTSTLNSVEFSWDDIDCASKYEIKVDGVDKGNQTNLKYLLSNLVEGTKVIITVLPITDCLCPGVPKSKECIAKKCPTITLELSTPSNNFCLGTVTSAFNLVAKANGSGGTGIGTWSGTGVTAAGSFNPSGLTAGTYTLTYKFTEENCDFSEKINIVINPAVAVAVVTTSPDCFTYNFGTAIQTTTGGTEGYTYRLDGNAIELSGLDKIDPGSHILVVNDSKGCNASTSFKIDSAPEPSMTVEGQPELLKGQVSTIAILSLNLPLGITADSIVWKNKAGVTLCSGPNCKSISFTAIQNDEYCATAYYNSGCKVSDCFSQLVEPVIDIVLPNIIKVGDPQNGGFFIQNFKTIEKIDKMAIYDRWGNLVFLKENFAPLAQEGIWDGKLNNSDVVPGVYVYTIVLTKKTGRQETFNGDITVVR